MINLIVNLEGTIQDFTKSYSGNSAFYILDKNNRSHYCFIPNKIRIGEVSDKIYIVGEKSQSDKIRIVYAENLTNNQTYDLTSKPSNSIHSLSLILLIGLIIGLIISITMASTINFTSIDPNNPDDIIIPIMSIVVAILCIIGILILAPFLYYSSKSNKQENTLRQYIMNHKKIEFNKITPNFDNNQKELELEKDHKYCSNCGQELSLNIKYCPYCGTKL